MIVSNPLRRSSRRTAAARRRARLPRTLGPDRRTRHRTVGAKDATIARLRPQPRAATRALVIEPTGIGRHRLGLGRSAIRAGNDRFEDHGSLSKHAAESVRDVRPLRAYSFDIILDLHRAGVRAR